MDAVTVPASGSEPVAEDHDPETEDDADADDRGDKVGAATGPRAKTAAAKANTRSNRSNASGRRNRRSGQPKKGHAA